MGASITCYNNYTVWGDCCRLALRAAFFFGCELFDSGETRFDCGQTLFGGVLCHARTGCHFLYRVKFVTAHEVEAVEDFVHTGADDGMKFLAGAGHGGKCVTGEASEVVEKAGSVSHDEVPAVLRRVVSGASLGSLSGADYTGRMIIVTGGAGFIGSCLHAALRRRGLRTVVVDRLRDGVKWRNLASHAPDRIITPDELEGFLASEPDVEAVFHMGAISATTARDGDLVWSSNVALSQTLWRWCGARGVRMIYASSAATYGAADRPEMFRDGLEGIDGLRPLNLYGWSKQAFDLWVKREIEAGAPVPPQWAGLKFFNVYGPNEYHKGSMISVVKVKYDEVVQDRAAKLFRSDVPGLADGQQQRDFIWVGDVVNVMLWLFDHPQVSGLFNCGTGVARSYLDLAHAVCDAAKRARDVEFVDMPEKLRGQYQSFTCADMSRLRAAGYDAPFTSLEDGIGQYVRDYLSRSHPNL